MSLTSVALDSTTALASATVSLIGNLSDPIPSEILHDPPDPAALATNPPRHANAVGYFMIGLAIVTLASVMNAAGLNLTKLDHVSSKPLLSILLK